MTNFDNGCNMLKFQHLYIGIMYSLGNMLAKCSYRIHLKQVNQLQPLENVFGELIRLKCFCPVCAVEVHKVLLKV